MVVFLICPMLFLFIHPGANEMADYTVNSYKHFWVLNQETIKLFDLHEGAGKSWDDIIFKSEWGLTIMRFIAFAYTYHYLNWFSKTTVIGWHKVSKKRLLVIGGLWVASLALYGWNYKLGFDFLFCLSFMHVFLEFPLNGMSIVGTFKELGKIISGKKEVAVSASKPKGQK